MCKIIIWGHGKYYAYKMPYLAKQGYHIVGIVGNRIEKEAIDGYPVIDKKEIQKIDYDKIVIMSERFMFEILDEIVELGIAVDKVVLGANLAPATESEMEYISNNASLNLSRDGTIMWNHDKVVKSMADIEKIKKINRGYISERVIRELPIKPLSYNYGISRGGHSIARYYIDKFVEEQKKYIRGTVMEVGDARYTKWGGQNVKKSLVLVLGDGDGEKYVKGDLETGEGLEKETLDCFILTNVFSSLFNINEAIKNVGESLKKGGKAIITVPGIAALCRAQYETYGQFWRFTPSSIERLLKEHIPDAKMKIRLYGNVKTSIAFLYGMTIEDLGQEELNYLDSNYPMVIGVFLEK